MSKSSSACAISSLVHVFFLTRPCSKLFVNTLLLIIFRFSTTNPCASFCRRLRRRQLLVYLGTGGLCSPPVPRYTKNLCEPRSGEDSKKPAHRGSYHSPLNHDDCHPE